MYLIFSFIASDLTLIVVKNIHFVFLNSFIIFSFSSSLYELIKLYGREAIFHKAYDDCPDKEEALCQLIECGIDRVLTGGGKCPIEEGSILLGELQNKYGDKIQILPGGGVRESNVNLIIERSHCNQIHMTAKATYFDRGEYFAVGENNLKAIQNKIKEGK